MMFLLGLLMVGIVYIVVRELEGWNHRRLARQSWQKFEAERRRREAEEAARPDSDVTWRCDVSDLFVCSLCEKYFEQAAPVFYPNWQYPTPADERRLLYEYWVQTKRLRLCHDCFWRIALCDPANAPETVELKVRKDWVDTVGRALSARRAAADQAGRARLSLSLIHI